MNIQQSDKRWAQGDAPPDVITIGDPALRQPAVPYEKPSDAQGLCDEMVARLRALNGAGLAANQIGQARAVVVIEVRKTDFFPDRPESPLYTMINPVILSRSGVANEDWEGCFSIPGLMGKVPRADQIEVEYYSPNGTRCRERFDGYLARVVQHECDHLEGTIFLDRMNSMSSISTIANYTRFHRPHAEV